MGNTHVQQPAQCFKAAETRSSIAEYARTNAYTNWTNIQSIYENYNCIFVNIRIYSPKLHVATCSKRVNVHLNMTREN